MNRLAHLLAAMLLTLVSCAPKPASDEEILDRIEQATIKYFTEFAEPNTGMARERNEDVHGNIVTTGGTGFGMMAIIAGAERGYFPSEEGEVRLEKII
ncbi:MAG: beta-glucosidase, partial [Bacteroidales bacterium]|nr:beta-glucosidase [Bacteroidales bacterium]